MKLQGILAEVGRTTSGVNGTTGKEWTCRELSLLVPYTKDNGNTDYDNIVADYFGEASDNELQAMIAGKEKLNFTVQFSTRKYNDRRYQSARVWGLAKVI